MKHLPKIFLALAVISFVIGATDLAENMFFYLGRPVGAISFILFLIFQFLQKETALYDADQRTNLAAVSPQAKEQKSPREQKTRQIPAHA
jgi:hypothetical protein